MVLQGSGRTLLAVLSADVAGYSRLMELDEEETHKRFIQLRSEVLDSGIADHHGRMIKSTGDGFLAAFESVPDAVRCAVRLQECIALHNSDEPGGEPINFRMGLNVCDAFVEKDDIYGDGINVAARLQSYAEPGGIVAAAAVIETLAGRLEIPTVDLGELRLKNISKSVHAFSLRAGGSARAHRPVRVTTPNPKASIAVLPFRVLQVDPAERYFADGVAEEIIRNLGGLWELLVISRISTLHYDGASIDPRTVGQELGVRYVLSGALRRAGNRMRITTELSETRTGATIRSDRYDGDASDLFELQDEIAVRVVGTIAPHVHEWELRRAMRKHPESMDAYDLVLQGLDRLYRLDYDSFSRARGFFQQALECDPYYAAAYTYAAKWHVFRISQGWSPDPNADATEAGRLVALAIEYDRHDSLALALRGHILSWFFKRYDQATDLLERALMAGPSCAMAWTMSSCTCSYLGDGPTAVTRAEQGVRLSPVGPYAFYHHCVLALAHYINGTYDASVAYAHIADTQNPSFLANKRFLIVSLVAQEKLAEARHVARDLLKFQPGFCLTKYLPSCPLRDPKHVALFVQRLRMSGLPD